MGELFRFSTGSNQPPVWTALPASFTFNTGVPSSASFAQYVTDPETPNLSFTFVGTVSSAFSLNNTLRQIEYVGTGIGQTFTGIQIEANDGNGGVSRSSAFSIILNQPNAAPVWSTTTSFTRAAGTTFDLKTICTDTTAPPIIFAATTVLPSGFSLAGSTGIVSIASSVTAASYAITFSATDALGLSASKTITFVVTTATSGFVVSSNGVAYNTLPLAHAAAQPGDTITVLPGSYIHGKTYISKNNLTIRGSNAVTRPKITQNDASNARFLDLASGISITVENIEFIGKKVGAFYPQEEYNFLYTNGGSYTVTVRNCHVREFGNGIQIGFHPQGNLIVENCNFENNGNWDGHTHHIYAECDYVTVRGSWIHNSKTRAQYVTEYGVGNEWRTSQGHLIKSRSKHLLVQACRLTTEAGETNRCIDCGNGGDLTVTGCHIEFNSPRSPNPGYQVNGGYGQAISWGVEGTYDTFLSHTITICQNTITNRSIGWDWLWIGIGKITDDGPVATPPPSSYTVRDNIFVGWAYNPPRTAESGAGGVFDVNYKVSTTENVCGTSALIKGLSSYNYYPLAVTAGAQNWCPYNYVHPAQTIARTDSQRGAVVSWQPTRDVNNAITNFSALPERVWVEIPDSQISNQITPLLDATGHTIYKGGDGGVAAVIDSYNGMAWDFTGRRGWAHGGGHALGSDNGVYKLNLDTFKWSIEALPSHPTLEMAADMGVLYTQGVKNSGQYGTTDTNAANIRIYPLAESSTGFALMNYLSYTVFSWCEVQGPARYVLRTAVATILCPNGVPYTDATARATYSHLAYAGQALEGPTNQSDVMPGGKPTARHTYNGIVYLPGSQEILMAVRAYWRCKVDGTGWVLYPDGGRKVYGPTYVNSEGTWTFADEVNNRIVRGGCLSECYQNNYYFYNFGVYYNPTTGVETATPRLTDSGSITQAGNLMHHPYKYGRTIGGWMPNGYGWNYNLDSDSNPAAGRKLYYMTGTLYTGDYGEGVSTVAIENLGQLWLFDGPSRIFWSVDLANATPGGPNNSLQVFTQREKLANNTYVPRGPADLNYTRCTYDPVNQMFIFVTQGTMNTWVCKLTS